MAYEALRFAKNGASNIANGLSAAMLTLVLPHFFVHDFAAWDFRLWVLLFQLAAFVSFLNFGIQLAIGRYVALALARNDTGAAGAIVGAGTQLLGILTGIALVLIGVTAWFLPVLFPRIEPSQIIVARLAFVWIGGAVAFGLLASAFSGALVGLQRNEIPATVNVIGKSALTIVLIAVAAHTHSLLAVAQVFFIGSLLIHLMQFGAFRIICREWHLQWGRGLSGVRQELTGYCRSLAVWSVAMLMVSGLDIMLVGTFDFREVAAYGLAASVVNYFASTFNSLLNPLIQVFARFHATGELNREIRLLGVISFLCTLFLLVSGGWMVGLGRFSFTLWIGPNLADHALPYFIVLLLANIIRNTAAPFALFLIANGQQRQVIVPPLIEGVTNLAFSVGGGWYFGAIGVAAGTLVGAVVGIIGAFAYSMPRTMPHTFERLSFFWRSLLVPSLIGLPLWFFVAANFAGNGDDKVVETGLALFLLAFGVVLARFRHDNPVEK